MGNPQPRVQIPPLPPSTKPQFLIELGFCCCLAGGLGWATGQVSSSCQNFLASAAFPQVGDIRNGLIWHELLIRPRNAAQNLPYHAPRVKSVCSFKTKETKVEGR
ncbi:hypothetical protein B1A65_11605 [Corynebacterium diphtheriae]|nr:hypothetical protein B1A65_11605 [Corynebacterium diphtheriae]